VAVLEFGAIDLDACLGIAEERFRHSFNYASLAGAGGAQEKQIADWAVGRIQPRKKHLVNFDRFFDRGVLAYDLASQGLLKIHRIAAALGWVKSCIKTRLHMSAASRC
jgi:hypothetical protein